MKLDNRGVSLVQIITTAALLSVSALVGIKMMRMQMKVAKTTALRFEVSYIMEEMVALLADPISCSANLKGLNAKKQENAIQYIAQEVVDPASNDILRFKWFETFEIGKKAYGQDLVKIMSYSLSDQGDEVDSTKGSTNLVVKFDRGERALGGQFISKKIKLNIKTDGNKISSCRAGRNPPRRVQTQFTWKYDFSESHIHHPGPVGIGGQASDAALTVSGAVQLLPSEEEPPCNATSEGALRYQASSDKILFCDGSGLWKTLGSSSINWGDPIQYTLLANGRQRNSITTGTHKRCHLSSVNKLGPVTCLIQKASNHQWKLQAIGKRGPEQYRCVANCYN